MTKQQKIFGGVTVAVLATAASIFVVKSNTTTHRTYRNDIFVCGEIPYSKDYYYSGAEDFMSKYDLQPGDTVAFKIGSQGQDTLRNVDMGLVQNCHDLVFLNDSGNKKRVNIGWFGLGNNVYNVKLSGNGSKYIDYGLNFYDSTHFGLSWGCVGNLETSYLKFDGCNIAFQLVTIPTLKYPVDSQKLYAHHLLIENSKHESMYLGYVNNSPIAMDIKVDSVTINNSGWDGIQTRNTRSVLITNCTLNGIGTALHEGDEHGILFGGNSNGGTVKNVIMKNVKGVGIWNGGWGSFEYSCNQIQADVFGVMSRSTFPEGDVQNTGKQSQLMSNNIINCAKAVECYYENNGKQISVDIQNNQTSGSINVSSGITQNISNNGANVQVNCTQTPPIPPQPGKKLYHRGYFTMTNGKRFFFIMYDDHTFDQTDGRYKPLVPQPPLTP